MSLDTNVWNLTTAAQTTTPGQSPSGSLAGVVGYQVGGTCNMVIHAEATIDGTNWVTVLLCEGNTATAATTLTISGVATYKLIRVDAAGYALVRLYVDTATSGTMTVKANTAIG